MKDLIYMDAIVFEKNNITVKDVDIPQLSSPDDVIIKIKAVGLCKTDLMLSKGLLPCKEGQILGHEFSGEIYQTGSNITNFKIGDKVAVNPILFCKKCHLCLSNSNNCENYEILGINKNGALTEYISVPIENVYKIPDYIDFDVAAYLEPVAAALSMLNVSFSNEKSILIFGSGRIARLSYLILKNRNYPNVRLVEKIDELKEDEQFDVIIENGVNPELFEALLNFIAIEGILILKSRNLKKVSFNASELIRKEISIKGVNYSSFDDAFNFLMENHQLFKDFIGKKYDFYDYQRAFEDSINSDKFKNFIVLG